MRESFNSRRFLSYLFILAIAVVFVLQFGPGSRGCEVSVPTGTTTAAATVNGREIPVSDFQRVYSLNYEYARQRLEGLARQLKQQVDIDAIARQQVRPEAVLDQMVTQELLAQAAERQDIVASNGELLEVLRKRPEFQREGKFDASHYQDVVDRRLRKTRQAYEDELRRELSVQKLDAVTGTLVNVSDEEVRTRYQRDADRADVRFIRFLPSMYADAVKEPTPTELGAWRAKHEKELQAEYDQNRAAYRVPEKVRARHLQLDVAPGASDSERDEVRKKIAALKEQLGAGKDFAELARESSQDKSTAAGGGDLGFRAHEEAWPAPPLANAAFQLPPGQVSDVIETPGALYLVKVEEKQPAADKPLEQVAPEIAKRLYKREKASERARAAAEKALAAAVSGKALSAIAPPKEGASSSAYEVEAQPTALETGTFPVGGGAIPRLGVAPELLREASAAEGAKLLPRLFDVGEGLVVAEVTARSRPSDAEFATKLDELRQQARDGKRMEVTESLRKALKSAAKIETHPEVLERPAEEAG